MVDTNGYFPSGPPQAGAHVEGARIAMIDTAEIPPEHLELA